jgi:hypothetical protein
MLKKILKRVFFGVSVIASALFGFVSGDKGHSDLSSAVLGEPIFSVRTAHADDGGGDCCCSSCDSDAGDVPVSSGPSSVFIEVIAQ